MHTCRHASGRPAGHYRHPAAAQGRAVQVGPIKHTFTAPGTTLLKLKYDTLVSSFAFNFNLRRCNKARHGTTYTLRVQLRAAAAAVEGGASAAAREGGGGVGVGRSSGGLGSGSGGAAASSEDVEALHALVAASAAMVSGADAPGGPGTWDGARGRALHSSTFQLNLSHFCH